MSPDDVTLRTLLSEAIAAADPALHDRLRTEPAAYVDLVALTARARTEAEVLLTLAVAGARSAGGTWADIGAALGVTESAARELYTPTDAGPSDAAPTDAALPEGALPEGALPEGALPEGALPEEALPEGALPEEATSTAPRAEPRATPAGERTQLLTRQTLFSEMRMLEHAGRYGWHLVGSGTATLVVRSSAEQWEHRRVFASRTTGRALEQDGWLRCGEPWFPWAYFSRPTGVPALPDPLDGSALRVQ